jgi:hypothetical protein
MLNLAMDLDNYLEQLLTYISRCWDFMSTSPKRKREDRVDEKGKIPVLLRIPSLNFGLETSFLMNTSVFK